MTDRHENPTRLYNKEANNFMDDIHIDSSSGKADVIKVSAKSRSTAVAGAIAAVIREHRYAEVQAIGAGAVNQAVKALAIARGYLTGDQIDIVCTPYFTEVDIEGQERTAVRFVVEPRP
jgi:stage V sporulation protein S